MDGPVDETAQDGEAMEAEVVEDGGTEDDVPPGPDATKISRPVLSGGQTPIPKQKTIKLVVPKHVHPSSFDYRMLKALEGSAVVVESSDIDSVVRAILGNMSTKKREDVAKPVIEHYIQQGYILLKERKDGKTDITISESLIISAQYEKPERRRKIDSLEFDYQRLIIRLDGKDIQTFSIEDLVMVRMLQMDSYVSSGLSQEEVIDAFLSSLIRKTNKRAKTVLEALEEGGFISPNGDGASHLTDEGFRHIIEHLHSVDSIRTPNVPPTEETSEEQTDRDRSGGIEQQYRDMGALILKPNKNVGGSRRKIEAVPQFSELSAETASVFDDLERFLSNGSEDIDPRQIVLGIINKEETQLVCERLGAILNGWQINAFLSAETDEYIPTLFTLQKPYDIEMVTGTKEMITARFRAYVVGDRMCVRFEDNVTIKDIAGLVRWSRDFDEMYEESTGVPVPHAFKQAHSNKSIHLGVNGIVYIGGGRFAYFPNLSSHNNFNTQTPRDLLAATR